MTMLNEFKNQNRNQTQNNPYEFDPCTRHDKLKILSIICSFKLNKKVCFDCNTRKSPLWRMGPLGANTLCNACGLRYKRINNTKSKNKQKTYHY
jgi:hypothetical protein